ncbi:hypothetical protein NUW54_g11835 [Trametes sanguinea]|uniref:Uncharacterized protein n=1 Tax=Trametes sanguinea TaxID=158606 RepID=A0ACC1N6E4_9APHY|nr:hypothetical protein NUW54_g11835 [Trametes sanguinea]
MHKFCLRPPDPAKYWQALEHVRCNTFASNAYPSSPRSAACLHLGIGSVPLEMIVFQECSPGRRTVTQPSTLTAQGAELHFESSRLGAASWREKHSCIMLWARAKEDYEIGYQRRARPVRRTLLRGAILPLDVKAELPAVKMEYSNHAATAVVLPGAATRVRSLPEQFRDELATGTAHAGRAVSVRPPSATAAPDEQISAGVRQRRQRAAA